MTIEAQRLLNVALALRESPAPSKFDMGYYSRCQTPACALGHYAFRTDLQGLLKLGTHDVLFVNPDDGDGDDDSADYDANAILDHFGIDEEEAGMLFSTCGCDGAKTALQAAQYIERFVKEKWGIEPPPQGLTLGPP